jgi:FkbM family methyltransferase
MIRRLYEENRMLMSFYQYTGWLRKPFSSKKLQYQEQVIKNLSLLLQEDPLLRIDEFEGEFYFDVRSHLFQRFVLNKCYEPKLVKLCKLYINPLKDIIDVGANIGLFTVLFGKNTQNHQKILSIEPTKNASLKLLKNIEKNNISNKVTVFHGVASNYSGTVDIETILGKEEYSSIGSINHPVVKGEIYSTEKVESKTVDDLVLANSMKPGLIKVDVEGCEHLVFTGAQNVLRDHRPIIISELSNFLLSRNDSSSSKVIELIKKNDYTIFDPLNPTFPPGSKEFGDIICFPSEMNMTCEKLASDTQ